MGLFVLALATVSVLVFLTTGESVGLKGIALALLVISLAFQFVPALQFHFLIPLLIQVIIGIWMAMYWQTS